MTPRPQRLVLLFIYPRAVCAAGVVVHLLAAVIEGVRVAISQLENWPLTREPERKAACAKHWPSTS